MLFSLNMIRVRLEIVSSISSGESSCVCISSGVVRVVMFRVRLMLMMLLFMVLFSVSVLVLIMNVCVLIISLGSEVLKVISSNLVMNGEVLKCCVSLEVVLMIELLFSVSSIRFSMNYVVVVIIGKFFGGRCGLILELWWVYR